MKKVSISLPTADWGQVKSKYRSDSSYLTPNDFTSGTQNIDTLTNGALAKRKGGTNYNGSLLTTAAKDQYEAIFADGTHHLLAVEGGRLSYSPGDTTFTTVTSGYSSISNFEFEMALDRVYFGNGITDQVYDRTTSYGGVTYTAPKTKVMGCQVPGSACSAALVVDGTANQVPAGAHTYKITYLYYGFEESNGSTASGVVTADGAHTQVSLTSVPTGGYGVTARKVYRDNNDGNYVLLATISDNTTTTYTDKNPSGGAVIPADNGVPPAFSLVKAWLDRLFFGKIAGDPYSIYYSAPGLPDIVYGTNFFKCNQGDPIVAIVVYLGRLVVLNRQSVGQILGTTSDTFRYVNIQTGVGCTDNRSVQIRTINGVPTLIWLSDKGFYQYNGSAVTYVSDPIEDLVNLNIQQALSTSGSNAQTTQADFQGGTASGGIDLTTVPGTITTRNPKRIWQALADWEGGSSLTNIATKDGTNTIKAIIGFAPSLASGILSGLNIVSSNLQTATTSDFPGESNTGATETVYFNKSSYQEFTQPFIASRAGTLTSVTVRYRNGIGLPRNVQLKVRRDNGNNPGTVVFTGGTQLLGSGYATVSETVSIAVSAGERIWIGGTGIGNGASTLELGPVLSLSSAFSAQPLAFNGSSWEVIVVNGGSTQLQSMAASYVFAATPNATSGQWLSQTYDTYSTNNGSGVQIQQAGSNGTWNSSTVTSYVTTVEVSTDGSSWTTSDTFNNLNSTQSVSATNKRYWRIRVQLSTTDDRATGSVGAPTLTFNSTATWISEAIDCTADVTAYNSLDSVNTAPGITVTVATSADNISYTSYGAFGSASVQRYIKVKVVIVAQSSDTTTANMSSLTLKWTIQANLISSGINCGLTPAGWDVFQSSYATNSGTVSFYMRSASTLGGLTGAFTAVTVGSFPTIAVNQFVQWKVIITSTADSVPTVDSVTVNWFVSSTNSIRVASLFYNRTYYLAAAEFSQTTNNLVLVMDGENKWRVYRGLSINTMGLFFNKPYYGSASNGQFINFLQGLTDSGTAIIWDVRTKAFDFANQYDPNAADALKILRSVEITGLNTGAVITPYFSVDNGTTWLPMLDSNGNSTVTTTSDNSRYVRALYPNFADTNVVSGRTIMFRLYNSDANAVEIHRIKLDAWIRKGQVYT